ncbi:MAG: hypothetical protein U0792_02445 [Gemmataceae bacterium]
MSGEFLRRPQIDTVPPQHGQVGVPQCVKVGVFGTVRAFYGVRDADGLKIATEHLGGASVFGPACAPDRCVRGFPRQVGAESGRHVGRERLHLGLPRLVPLRGECDGRRVGVQVEVGGCEIRQRVRPESGAGGEQIEHEPIFALQPPNRVFARPRGGEQGSEFVGREFAANTANIHGTIQEREGFEGVGTDPLQPHEPASEPPNGDGVAVHGSRAEPLRLLLRNRQNRSTGQLPGRAAAHGWQAIPSSITANGINRDTEQRSHGR